MAEHNVPGESPRQRDDVFRLLVESVKDYAIFLLDPAGRVRTWNLGARQIKGYRADEIIGQHFSIFYPPQEVRRGKPDYELRVAADEGRWAEEGWRLRKDGSRFWANVVITALRDATGELVGFAKVTRDLTERKQAEDERNQLLALERAARLAAERAAERLWAVQIVTEAALAHLTLDSLLAALLDRIGEILEADTVAVLLLAEDEEVLVARAAKGIEEEVEQGVRIPVGRGFAGRIVAERRWIAIDDLEHADVLNPILRQKGLRSLLGVPLFVEGQVIGVLHVGTLFRRHFTESDARFLQVVGDRVAMAIDRARLYEAARDARQEAASAGEAVRLRDEFLAVAAHELKTPVTSLQGYVDLLLRSLDQGREIDPARHRRILRTIHRQTEQLGRLTNQLLDTSRLEAGRLGLDRQAVDLTELVTRAIEQTQALMSHHEIALTAPATIPASVDPIRFEQVILNLLHNAVKYSPDDGRIDVELALPRPGTVRLSVRDRGLGISPGQRGRVFERYYQAHADSHRSGLGLGLHLSREIVELHGGRIWVEAPAGGGTRFVVELPLVSAT